MLLKSLIIQNKGNASLFALVVISVSAILIMFIFDFCQIFIAREVTKKTSDAASLAVAQNLLFFENYDCSRVAERMAAVNDCILVECRYDYDEVTVTVQKKLDFILIKKLIPGYSEIRASSKAKVVFPWEQQFEYCRSYKFNY